MANKQTKFFIMKTKIDFTFENLPVQKKQSDLVVLRAGICAKVNQETRSFSSYFREFRKQHTQIREFLELQNKRGRVFNADIVTRIIAAGEHQLILDADERLHEKAGKSPDPSRWNANRVFRAFIAATEIVKEKPAK
jgi:hypothetical protein